MLQTIQRIIHLLFGNSITTAQNNVTKRTSQLHGEIFRNFTLNLSNILWFSVWHLLTTSSFFLSFNNNGCIRSANNDRSLDVLCRSLRGLEENPPGLVVIQHIPTKHILHFKFRPISSVHNIYLVCSIILKFCTEHDSITAVLCAKFQNDQVIARLVIGKWFLWDLSSRWVLQGYCIMWQLLGSFMYTRTQLYDMIVHCVKLSCWE